MTSAGNIAQTGITAVPGFGAMAPTSSAFNFIFSSNGQVQAAINALRSVTNVTVLSAPQVVVQDNQPAKLEVGQQVPIQTGSATVLTGSNTIANTTDYRSTGIMLKVVPRINANGRRSQMSRVVLRAPLAAIRSTVSTPMTDNPPVRDPQSH